MNWKYGEDVIIAGAVSDEDGKRNFPPAGARRSPICGSSRNRETSATVLNGFAFENRPDGRRRRHRIFASLHARRCAGPIDRQVPSCGTFERQMDGAKDFDYDGLVRLRSESDCAASRAVGLILELY